MDTDRLPHGWIRINCRCCHLPQAIKDRDGAIPAVCDACYPHHRGERDEMRADRAESHEAMLRERLSKCRASEQRAREDADSYKDRMVEALRSRGALADRLVEAAEDDRTHNCRAGQIARDPQVIEFARRHRLLEDET